MAKVTRDKFDIVDLAHKHHLVNGEVRSRLIGVGIHLADGTIKEVESYYCDYAISMIYLVFVGESVAYEFTFGTKFIIDIDEYSPIKGKVIGKQKIQ